MINTTGKPGIWTESFENEIDYQFIQRVQSEVTTSCALPFALPADRIIANIRNVAAWFWQESDYAFEERYYVVRNADICRGNALNKIAQLPPQIMGVHGVYKIQNSMRGGAMGDFGLERILLSTYSMFGGAGVIGSGMNNQMNLPGYTLTDMTVAMYEVDTFNQLLNTPLSYNYNHLSKKLVLLGDLGYSDILICCNVRCRIQDLYEDYYFFRAVVAMCKRNLASVYGMYEFKLPGGVSINYSKLDDQADSELEEVKEYFENNRAIDYFFMPNTL